MRKIINLPIIFKPFKVGGLIRLGGNKDGGYLLSKRSLFKSNFLVSLGVAYNWDFEIDFLKKKNNKKLSVIAYDNSISREIVKRFSIKSFIFFFIKPSFKKIQHINKFFSYIRTFDGNRATHIPLNVAETRSSKNISIKEIFKFSKKEKIILKIDIEGNEYKLLKDILENLNQINVLIIEFHTIKKNIKIILNFIKKINKKFYISHTHVNNVSLTKDGNNAEIIEFTFEKKSLFNGNIKPSNYNYPIDKLDFPSSKKVDDCQVLFK